jgi:nicotinamidase-related amidase
MRAGLLQRSLGHVQVEVPAYPVEDEVPVDPERTALVVIDMQNDFVERGGNLVVPDAAATVGVIKRLLRLARANKMHVVYSQDTHHPGDQEWQIWPEHCREGSWGWQIVAELAPSTDDTVVRKSRYDAFLGTPLDDLLQSWGVDTLVFCGTVANICVQFTAASAAQRRYAVVIPLDAISAFEPFDLQSSLRQITFALSGQVTLASGIRAL